MWGLQVDEDWRGDEYMLVNEIRSFSFVMFGVGGNVLVF